MVQPFSCFIQGEGTLVISCADLLLQQGHRIQGIISSNPAIQKWAAANAVPTYALSKDVAMVIGGEPFDYFFSIANLAIVPEAVLALPRKLAINFHDSLLPRYAGLYATSWALLNQEPEHGITWHEMRAEVDAGRILKQRRIPVQPDETAFTLNAKCYEAAAAAFPELIHELATDTLTSRPQDSAAHSYFGKYQRPPQAGWLDWTQPAEQINALVRALDFGPYENPLLLPKVGIAGQVWAVSTVRPAAAMQAGVPGTILAVDAAGITVATGSTPLRITRLTTLTGEAVSMQEIAMRVGDLLTTLSPADSDQLSTLYQEVARHERYWVRQLQQIQAPELPYADRSGMQPLGTHRMSHQALTTRLDADALVTVFAAYLARLSGMSSFSLGWRAESPTGFAEIFAETVPLPITLDEMSTADAVHAAVQNALTQTRKRQTYARDVRGRMPALRALPAESFRLPVVVTQSMAADTPYPDAELVLHVGRGECCWVYDPAVYSETVIATLEAQFEAFAEHFHTHSDEPLARLSLLTAAEARQVLHDWNATERAYPSEVCVHQAFEQQVERTPQAIALAFADEEWTYAELNARANQVAHHLLSLGIQPDDKIGLCMERSAAMMVGLLGILKAGAAYVPLDPAYPADRIALMMEDAQVPVLISQGGVALPAHPARVIDLEHDWATIAHQPQANPIAEVRSHHLCYMIYTSGSTGKPKGVMIEHRNVLNFFTGMDERIPVMTGATWLAVTSLSFDISVLELFWTLARGFKVVIYADARRQMLRSQVERPIDFSLFYFASYSAEGTAASYDLLLEGARFGDAHGFAAVWTPERHFGNFGGLYPNPAVTSAAIAATTQRIQIRAGSVVSPLHNPIRIAEDWSLVDNLSKGRVGISFAAGWHPNDFVLKPENFADRKAQMFRDIETVQQLWRGETVSFPGPNEMVPVRTLPRPVQPRLPVWITVAGNPETFASAGAAGYNVLTHLLGQSVEQLAEKLAVYHQAWQEAGHPGRGQVVLMLHTYVAESTEEAREVVRQPMINYLASALELTEQAAWSFPAFKQRAEATGKSLKEMFATQELNEDEKQAIFAHAFERYFETSGLFGDLERCIGIVDRLKQIGVDEIGCLIDFGVPTDLALAHLHHLNALRERVTEAAVPQQSESIPQLIERHAVTHFQCTPSMADMLLLDNEAERAFQQLQVLMIGGEAFPSVLAQRLQRLVGGQVLNMYGPTETTIWSTTHQVGAPQKVVSIGRPIANTTLYLLDGQMQPVPLGLPGELYIGGAGVVRGYWNRPDLTAERFVADPFSTLPDARLYKTGDQARYLPDGTLEFLGRNDFQVKLRGYRIELGEIEAALDAYPAIQKSVVMAREDVPGDKRLVAYVLLAQGTQLDEAALREALKAQMPDFMVPAHVLVLQSFPLTPNKKVDRKALPKPDMTILPSSSASFAPPESSLEQQIASIWQELLGLSSVGLNDNFFELGGHSILAVQAQRLLVQRLAVELNVTDLFRFTTVRALAGYLQAQQAAAPAEANSRLQTSLNRAELRKQRMRGG
jgi:natural product biosynthesis luciferase-like monooxygenase protein